MHTAPPLQSVSELHGLCSLEQTPPTHRMLQQSPSAEQHALAPPQHSEPSIWAAGKQWPDEPHTASLLQAMGLGAAPSHAASRASAASKGTPEGPSTTVASKPVTVPSESATVASETVTLASEPVSERPATAPSEPASPLAPSDGERSGAVASGPRPGGATDPPQAATSPTTTNSRRLSLLPSTA